GRDLGPPARGARRRPGGAAGLRRPGRADRHVRHAQGDPPRPAGRRRRPGDGHPRAARLRDDRRRRRHRRGPPERSGGRGRRGRHRRRGPRSGARRTAGGGPRTRPRGRRRAMTGTPPAPGGTRPPVIALAAAASGAAAAIAAVLLDLFLLAPAALALGALAGHALGHLPLAGGRALAARTAEPPLIRGAAAVLAPVLGVAAGLLTAVVADLWLIEPAAYGIGAAAGGAATPLIHRTLGRMLALAISAVAVAVLLSLLVTALVLVVTGVDPLFAFTAMLDHGTKPDSIVTIANNGSTLYLSAVAVAIGFKMKLFNIGVDGQYRLAALLAAAVGGAVTLPPVLHQAVIITVAVAVGGMWAGLAGYLKVARGVSEVISTIMLNSIATGITAYLLTTDRLAVEIGTNNIGTPEIAESGWVPCFPMGFMGARVDLVCLVLLSDAVGAGY